MTALIPAAALDYDKPIQIAEGVYWVGFYDHSSRLHCNPYVIVDHDEAVLIDAGSRPDFSSVMMKVLDVIEPSAISAIVLSHYDPDLCGSVPIFEEMIGNENLVIISHRENNAFIKHYSIKSPVVCFESLGGRFRFRSGRELTFHRVPFAHSAGSFMTLDPRSGTLFTGDLFGSYCKNVEWQLFVRLEYSCRTCLKTEVCPTEGRDRCPVPGILDFHRRIMTSSRAVRYAMAQVRAVGPKLIAPQHGSVIHRPEDIELLPCLLDELPDVGIDAYPVES